MISKSKIIKLDNGDTYFILDMVSIDNKSYVYTVAIEQNLVDINGIYAFFEVLGNNVNKIDDVLLEDKLYEEFSKQMLARFEV